MLVNPAPACRNFTRQPLPLFEDASLPLGNRQVMLCREPIDQFLTVAAFG
jgi:hypothetical protein